MNNFETDNDLNINADTSLLNADESTTRWVQYTFWGFVGLAVLLFVALSVLAFRQKPEAGIQTAASQQASVLLSLSPEVTYKDSPSGQFQPVKGRVTIDEGDEIKTSQDARAMLLYPNGTLTALKANTHVAIDKLQDGGSVSRLSLLAGGLWSRVEETLTGNETYAVESNQVVTSVRGTEFSIDKTGESIALNVVSDEVALASIRSGNTQKQLTTLLSGEKLQFDATNATDTLDANIASLSDNQLQKIIQQHDEVSQQLTTSQFDRLAAQVQGRLIPSDSRPYSPTRSTVEQIGESVSSLFVQSPEKRVRHFLTLAEERLTEAKQLAANKKSIKAVKAATGYQKMIGQAVRAAAKSGKANLQQLVVESTRSHQNELDMLEKQVPETYQPQLQLAQNIAEGGHTEALESLAQTNPTQAYQETVSSMRSNLRSAQSESVSASDRGLQNKLREYDRIMQLSADIADKSTSSQAAYADQLRKSLSVIETVDSIAKSGLTPGTSRVIDDARQRTVKSQQATLATIAQKSPQQAAKIYGKTSDMYLSRLRRQAEATSSEESVADAADVYSDYAQFGEKLSRLAQAQSAPGATTTRKLVEQATARHTEVLQQVQKQVPEAAQPAIEQAITVSRNVGRPEGQTGAPINPEEFVQQQQEQRPQGELKAPAVSEPETPLPESVSQSGQTKQRGQSQTPQAQAPDNRPSQSQQTPQTPGNQSGQQPGNTGQNPNATQGPGQQGQQGSGQQGQQPNSPAQTPGQNQPSQQPSSGSQTPNPNRTNVNQSSQSGAQTPEVGQPSGASTGGGSQQGNQQSGATQSPTNSSSGASSGTGTGSAGTQNATGQPSGTNQGINPGGVQSRHDSSSKLSFLQSGLTSLLNFIH